MVNKRLSIRASAKRPFNSVLRDSATSTDDQDAMS